MDSFIIVDMYIFIVIAFLWTPLIEDQILRYVVYKPYLLLLLLLDHESKSRALIRLHWLPVDKRINYKLLMYMYKALHHLAPG